MKRALKVLVWTMLVSLVLGIALVLAVWSMAGSMDPMTVQIDGDTVSLANLDAAHGLVAIGGIAIALLVVALVVPLAVLIPLAIVAVVLVGVLLVLAGVLAMVCSPLIFGALVIWLMVRLIRRSPAKGQPGSSATITG